MGDSRRDYGIVATFLMREEAEVAASALRAHDIDAFVSPGFHASYDWHLVHALGGLKVWAPFQKLEAARALIGERKREALESPDPEAEPTQRRDRFKVWLVIASYVGVSGLVLWFANREPPEIVYAPPQPQAFAPDRMLTAAEKDAARLDYCLDMPWDSVQVGEGALARSVPCADILSEGQVR